MTTSIAIVGNLTADPELRFTASGKAIASLNVAVNERRKAADGSWEDGEATFWRVTAFGTLAENVGDSLSKGQRVVVNGKVSSRTWETKEGDKRVSYEITADGVGPDLRWAKVKVERGVSSAKVSVLVDDPWAQAAVGLDEVPF